MIPRLSPALLAQWSEFVTAHLGLHFPPERWPDLERGLCAAGLEPGGVDVEDGLRALVSAPPTRQLLETLASHLTIGETYFFREQKTLTIFAEQVLPGLIAERRAQGQCRLRLWSAGCCSGEEPYSLAILLRQALPDARDWDITILGTDINPVFLQKAAAGVYSAWSFRTTPDAVKEKYFQKTPEGRFAITESVKQMVTFSSLNLAEDSYPSLVNGTAAMDVIFCRNVLIYFAAPAAQKIVGGFHRALADRGWLIVSPTEASAPLFADFVTVNYPGATLYCKETRVQPRPDPEPFAVKPLRSLPLKSLLGEPTPAQAPLTKLRDSFLPKREGEAGKPSVNEISSSPRFGGSTRAAGEGGSSESALQSARACADEGRLAEARQWCDKAIAAEKLNPLPYYLKATILQEEGKADEAAGSLKRALYLDHTFVPAHFALGNLARQQGKVGEADRHFAQALALLQNYGQDDILPELEGMTAGRLSHIIAALRTGKTAS